MRRKPCITRQNPLSADFKSEVIITYVSIADKTVSATKQRLQLVEKVCFFKKSACSQSLSPNPFPRERGYITGATAPRPCRGLRPKARMLWLLAKSFARCKTNRASNKRHPIFRKHKGLSTDCSLCKKAEAYINQLLSDKVMLSALFPSVSKITISFLPFFRSGAGIYSFF